MLELIIGAASVVANLATAGVLQRSKGLQGIHNRARRKTLPLWLNIPVGIATQVGTALVAGDEPMIAAIKGTALGVAQGLTTTGVHSTWKNAMQRN